MITAIFGIQIFDFFTLPINLFSISSQLILLCPVCRKMPEYRKLVKQFNDTGVILMRHEVDVQTAWLNRNPSIRQFFGHTKPHEVPQIINFWVLRCFLKPYFIVTAKPFELGGGRGGGDETRLIRSAVKYRKPGNFSIK
jgi:hypothetical protein